MTQRLYLCVALLSRDGRQVQKSRGLRPDPMTHTVVLNMVDIVGGRRCAESTSSCSCRITSPLCDRDLRDCVNAWNVIEFMSVMNEL